LSSEEAAKRVTGCIKEGHAVSGGGSNPSQFIEKLIGPKNESPVKVNGVSCTSLLDTGSQVSTICVDFVHSHLPGVVVQPLNDLLTVEVAGGSTLSYLGFVEVDLELPGKLVGPGHKSIPALLLVVPTTNYNSSIPVLLGTNVIYSCKSLVSGDCRVPGVWHDVFKVSQLQLQMRFDGIPVFSSGSVDILGGQSVIIDVEAQVTSAVAGGKSLCLDADGNMCLPSGVLMTPMWLDKDSVRPKFQIELINISDRKVQIPASTEVCRAFPVNEVLVSSDDVLQSQAHQVTSQSLDSDEFLNMFSLGHLDGDVRQQTTDLLLKYRHVFQSVIQILAW